MKIEAMFVFDKVVSKSLLRFVKVEPNRPKRNFPRPELCLRDSSPVVSVPGNGRCRDRQDLIDTLWLGSTAKKKKNE